MLNCPLCNKKFGILTNLSKHIHKNHNIDSKSVLIISYPELFRDCVSCGIKIKYYKTDSQGRKFCCKDCELSWRRGRKQSQETIKKRIKNTDQKKKEQNRQKTMMYKYGKLSHANNPSQRATNISNALTGIKHTKEHHEKITESKKRNGTLNHSVETKNKIAKTIKNRINSPGFDKSVFVNQRKSNPKQGYYKGFYCRSSYEKIFVDFCEKYDIILESAENNQFSVPYESDGKIKTYFPDFYLKDFDLVIEIKPDNMYDYGDNLTKFHSAKLKYRFEVLTEENYLLQPEKWDLLYEYIYSI